MGERGVELLGRILPFALGDDTASTFVLLALTFAMHDVPGC